MIRLTTGDILGAETDALVNTVNCVGIMGRGIALQFKKAYPANFKAYETACKHNDVQPGRMFVFATGKLTSPRYIINFPTKRHWKAKTRVEDIDSGLVARRRGSPARHSLDRHPRWAAAWWPRLARCEAAHRKALETLPGVQAVVFEPDGAPEADRMVHAREAPAMTPGAPALVGLMHRELMRWIRSSPSSKYTS